MIFKKFLETLFSYQKFNFILSKYLICCATVIQVPFGIEKYCIGALENYNDESYQEKLNSILDFSKLPEKYIKIIARTMNFKKMMQNCLWRICQKSNL